MFHTADLGHIEDSAIHEIQRYAVVHQQHDRYKAKRCTGNRKNDVFFPGSTGFLIHGVHDQRQGCHGQKLIEQVHGNQVCRERDPHDHAHRHGKERKELLPQLHQVEPEVDYHHSFMFDATVYKIDDVRKREENEKHK